MAAAGQVDTVARSGAFINFSVVMVADRGESWWAEMVISSLITQSGAPGLTLSSASVPAHITHVTCVKVCSARVQSAVVVSRKRNTNQERPR